MKPFYEEDEAQRFLWDSFALPDRPQERQAPLLSMGRNEEEEPGAEPYVPEEGVFSDALEAAGAGEPKPYEAPPEAPIGAPDDVGAQIARLRKAMLADDGGGLSSAGFAEAQKRDARQGALDRMSDHLKSAFTRRPYQAIDRGPGQAQQMLQRAQVGGEIQKQRASRLDLLEGGADSPAALMRISIIGKAFDNDPEIMAKLKGRTVREIDAAFPYFKEIFELQGKRDAARAKAAADARDHSPTSREAMGLRAVMETEYPKLTHQFAGKSLAELKNLQGVLEGRYRAEVQSSDRQLSAQASNAENDRRDKRDFAQTLYLAELARKDREQARADAREAKTDEKTERELRQWTGKIPESIKTGLDTLDLVDKAVAEAGGLKNIDGVGVWSQWTPGMFLSPAGQFVRQNLADALNEYLKATSGTAVTDPEFVRVKRALSGSGTEAEVANGIAILRRKFLGIYAAKAGPASPAIRGRLDFVFIPEHLWRELPEAGGTRDENAPLRVRQGPARGPAPQGGTQPQGTQPAGGPPPTKEAPPRDGEIRPLPGAPGRERKWNARTQKWDLVPKKAKADAGVP